MFIDYGLYSVAGYAPPAAAAMYPDWYLFNMYHDSLTKAYHQKTWERISGGTILYPCSPLKTLIPQALPGWQAWRA